MMFERLLKWCCFWSKEEEQLAHDAEHGIVLREPVWRVELSEEQRNYLLVALIPNNITGAPVISPPFRSKLVAQLQKPHDYERVYRHEGER
jgi:hypothetical protein